MKALLVFIGFVLIAASYQQKPIMSPSNLEFWTQMTAAYNEECLVESGVDPVLADRMIRYKEFPNDRALGCFIKCFTGPTRLNTISTEGELLVDNLIEIVGAPSNLIEHCKELKGLDLCETALSYGRCIYLILTDWTELNLKNS